MTLVRYLTHPQVQIDADKPVPQWALSEVGAMRIRALVHAGWLAGTTQIVSSAETKALQTAEPIAKALGVEIEVRGLMHENDRSATGFIPPEEFELVADQFFAKPQQSIRGWERAIDAQARIVGEAELVLSREIPGDLLFVGHGAVGTLLYCHYAGFAISRKFDQSAGGSYFAMSKEPRKVLHHWRDMERGPDE